MAKHDLGAIKKSKSIESKDAVNEDGIWFHAALQEFQGYVVMNPKTKYLVSAVTESFLANDSHPDTLIDSLLKHIDDFRARKMK